VFFEITPEDKKSPLMAFAVTLLLLLLIMILTFRVGSVMTELESKQNVERWGKKLEPVFTFRCFKRACTNQSYI
jgi:hypothetical protein